MTSIGSNAFDGCTSLSELTFPDDLESIGGHAFRDTAWLTHHPLAVIGHILADGTLCEGKVVIPAGVTSITNAAFEDCTGLTSVTIPDQVTDIGAYAFRNCTGLTSVYLPASLTNVSCGLFKATPHKGQRVRCAADFSELCISDCPRSRARWASA